MSAFPGWCGSNNDPFCSRGYRFHFNGKELESTLGLDFDARMYKPEIARWLSTDPMAGEFASLSAYSYAANNPILFRDPNGRQLFLPKGDNYKADQVQIFIDALEYVTGVPLKVDASGERAKLVQDNTRTMKKPLSHGVGSDGQTAKELLLFFLAEKGQVKYHKIDDLPNFQGDEYAAFGIPEETNIDSKALENLPAYLLTHNLIEQKFKNDHDRSGVKYIEACDNYAQAHEFNMFYDWLLTTTFAEVEEIRNLKDKSLGKVSGTQNGKLSYTRIGESKYYLGSTGAQDENGNIAKVTWQLYELRPEGDTKNSEDFIPVNNAKQEVEK